jgi:hypothetical protein
MSQITIKLPDWYSGLWHRTVTTACNIGLYQWSLTDIRDRIYNSVPGSIIVQVLVDTLYRIQYGYCTEPYQYVLSFYSFSYIVASKFRSYGYMYPRGISINFLLHVFNSTASIPHVLGLGYGV